MRTTCGVARPTVYVAPSGPASITPDTIGVDYGRRVVNEFFETSKKKSKRRPRGRSVRRGLRALFNLGLVLTLAVAVGISCLYLFVLREYENDLDRTYPQLAENSYVYDVDGN